MNVLLIAPYAFPERGAAVIRVDGMRQAFEQRGHAVRVIAPSRPGVLSNDQVQRYHGMASLFRHIQSSKADLVIGTSPPMTHNFFAQLSCRLTGKKFVLDAKDPFTYFYAKQHPQRVHGAKFRFYQWMEREAIRRSDRVLALSDYNASFLQKEFGVPRERIIISPNGSDFPLFKKARQKRDSIRKKLGFPRNAVVFLYSGVIGGKDLDTMIQSVSRKAQKNSRFLFLLTNDSTAHGKKAIQEFHEWVRRNGLEKQAAAKTNLPYGALPPYYAASDIALNPLASYDRFCIPTKTYDYIAAGIPSIAKGPAGGALEEFMKKNPIGSYATDWPAFNQSIQQPEKLKAVRSFLKKNRTALEKQFSRKDSMAALVKELEGLV